MRIKELNKDSQRKVYLELIQEAREYRLDEYFEYDFDKNREAIRSKKYNFIKDYNYKVENDVDFEIYPTTVQIDNTSVCEIMRDCVPTHIFNFMEAIGMFDMSIAEMTEEGKFCISMHQDLKYGWKQLKDLCPGADYNAAVDALKKDELFESDDALTRTITMSLLVAERRLNEGIRELEHAINKDIESEIEHANSIDWIEEFIKWRGYEITKDGEVIRW